MTEPASDTAGSESSQLSSSRLAQMIDISAVQAFHTEDDIRSLAVLALERRFIAAHALPHFVPLLRSLIPVSGCTLVGAPIGFPSGGHTTMIKLAEARSGPSWCRRVGYDDQPWTLEVWRSWLRAR